MSRPEDHPRFFPVVSHAARDHGLSRAAVAVLGYLTSWWWTTGRAFPSVATIAAETAVHPRTARRALRSLEAAGYLRTIRNYDPITGRSDRSTYVPGDNFTLSGMGAATPPRAALPPYRDKGSVASPPATHFDDAGHSDRFRDDRDRPKPGAPRAHWLLEKRRRR